MTDYQKALKSIQSLAKFNLGDEANTPIGKGIIVSMEMPSNGLYLSPEKATAIVWFSTAESQNGWVQRKFRMTELIPIKIAGEITQPTGQHSTITGISRSRGPY